MTKEKVEKYLRHIISQYNAIPEKNIKKNSILQNLGLDSLDTIDLALAIEREYDIEITGDKKMWEIVTFSDLVKMILAKLEVNDGNTTTN